MIHSTAIIDPQASLATDVRIGPFVVIEGNVTIGAGTLIDAHTVVRGNCIIGENCQIGPAAYVGTPPQHLGFTGGETWLTVGDNTIIRENVSLHRSSKPGIENATRVGSSCFIMATAHVGHDSVVGDHVVLANGVLLGGHVLVGDRAFLGGGSVVHQFCRIGRLGLVRGNEALSKDLPPFGAIAFGGMRAYNAIGCRRAGISRESIRAIRAAYHIFHTTRMLSNVITAMDALEPHTPEVDEIIQFMKTTQRGILISRRFAGGKGDYDE